MPRPLINAKPVFRSAREAKIALSADRLGTCYVTADKVFVATAQGTGTFPRAEWEASK